MRVVAIVEGEGEVVSVPILLRRIADWRSPGLSVDVPPPIRVRRDRFIQRPEEFDRFLKLAAAKCGETGWILILLDADDDCPAELGSKLADAAATIVGHRRVSTVLANREYEAWFLAAAESLHGRRGFDLTGAGLPADPDGPRDAKGWIRQQLRGRSYGATTDQPAFTAAFDLEAAALRSRSFRKLCAEWDHQAGT